MALLIITVLVACAPPAKADDIPLQPVTLQLKWKHQFQFAGYYIAKAHGYYREEGLDVTLKEHTPNLNVVTEVLEKRAQFGVGNADLLLNYYSKKSVVALGAIFQHTPNALLSREETGITHPEDLRGKRVMLGVTPSPAIWTMLTKHGITMNDIVVQNHSWNTEAIVSGNTDAIEVYLMDQPYALDKVGIKTNIMRPLTFGVDYYGDILFTSKMYAKNSPKMVEAFTRASLKGWEYAMAHVDEVINIILTEYTTHKSADELHYEAEVMRELIMPKLMPIGSMSKARWQHIADSFAEVGMVRNPPPLDDFLYIPMEQRRQEIMTTFTPYLTGISVAITMAILMLLFFNRRLTRGIEKRTKELDRNRESLRQVIDLMPNMIYAKNREGEFILVNRTMADSLGTTVEALTGVRQEDVHPDQNQTHRMQEDDNVVFDTGFPKVNMEEPYLFADGTIHWLQTTRLPFTSANTDEPAVLTLCVDITNRRIANQALKASEERFRGVFNQTYQLSGILDLAGTLTQTNETAIKVFGLSPSEVLNKPFWEAPWWNHDPKAQEWLKDAIRRAAKGETIRKEVAHPMPSGEMMIVDFSLKPARNEEGEISFLIPEGRDITSLKQSEEKLRRLNEELEHRVEKRTESLALAKEELVQSLEQLQLAQEELILSEKLAALGGLVAGVAHEINTPLGVGVTASSFLQEKIKELSASFDKGDLKRSDLEKFIQTGTESSESILVNLERAAELIKSFKKVAADQSSEQARKFNLHSYVDEVLLSLRPRYKRTGHVIENQCQDIEIYSYPGAFMQIINNLLINSLTHAYEEDGAGSIRMAGTVAEDKLTFTFSDDGSGMSPEIMNKAFEPFFTTNREKGGTGLGLHIVFNTVTQTLRGTIRLDSAPGQGTTYTITMPLDSENS